MARTYRVVQWATGNIGRRALRQVIRSPRLELSGVLVYDESKAGTDAGELCGEPATGVLATTDKQTLIDLGADCVLYMPRVFEIDDVVALLESGTNVVTTLTDLFDGGSALDDDGRRRVLDACTRGGSSTYATGSSPGFISELLPLTLLSLQREVDCIAIEEFADMSQRDSPELLFDLMGYGRAPATFDPHRSDHLRSSFGPSLSVVAHAAGRPVDSWSCTGEVAVAPRDLTIVAGEISAGTVAAQRTTVVGTADGTPVVSFTATWYCSRELDPAWDLRPTGWRVDVRGDAPLRVEMPFPVSADELGQVTPGYTANPAVNAVPYVVEARPGLLRTADLPFVVPAGPA